MEVIWHLLLATNTNHTMAQTLLPALAPMCWALEWLLDGSYGTLSGETSESRLDEARGIGSAIFKHFVLHSRNIFSKMAANFPLNFPSSL